MRDRQTERVGQGESDRASQTERIRQKIETEKVGQRESDRKSWTERVRQRNRK